MENTFNNINVESLSDDQAFHQFLNDMKEESPMKPRERRGFMEILRSQGHSLNRLMEIPVFETLY